MEVVSLGDYATSCYETCDVRVNAEDSEREVLECLQCVEVVALLVPGNIDLFKCTTCSKKSGW